MQDWIVELSRRLPSASTGDVTNVEGSDLEKKKWEIY